MQYKYEYIIEFKTENQNARTLGKYLSNIFAWNGKRKIEKKNDGMWRNV